MTARSEFLAGERPDDVAIYLADEHLRNAEALADRAERVEGGYVLVLEGERGRRVFQTVAGEAPMEFAQDATEREGPIERDLTGGVCPEDDGSGDADTDASTDADVDADASSEAGADHVVRFVLAFAQEQTDDVGGLYEEGDVIHAYARCACGAAFSDRWVVGDE